MRQTREFEPALTKWWEEYGSGQQHRLSDEAVRQRLFGMLAQMIEEHTQWVDAASVKQVIDRLLSRETKGQEFAKRLTPREREIVEQVVQGCSNREIADQLFISVGTVKIHLHQVFQKLKISNRWELIRYAAAYQLPDRMTYTDAEIPSTVPPPRRP